MITSRSQTRGIIYATFEGEKENRLFAEGVPRAEDRIDLFLELIHLSRAQERARHGLY